MQLNDFTATIDFWINALEDYSFDQLIIKHDQKKWSLGQLFIHLIESTNFYLLCIENCLKSEKGANEMTSDSDKEIFRINQLPNIEIEGPKSNNATPQPVSKKFIQDGLILLKNEFIAISELLKSNSASGKTKHPGLGYLNAAEWFQFAEIHMRHHIKQKNKIERLINKSEGK